MLDIQLRPGRMPVPSRCTLHEVVAGAHLPLGFTAQRRRVDVFRLAKRSCEIADPARRGVEQLATGRRGLAATLLAWCGGLVTGATLGVDKRLRRANAAGLLSRGGKVALITGASSGIGKAAALALATSGKYGTVVLAGRDAVKHDKAIDEIKAQAGTGLAAELKFLNLDLGSLASVRSCVAEFESLQLPLHTLVNNAAVMALPQRQTTVDGYEYQFEVNYLSHFLLTALLIPRLEASGSAQDPARIISVSSAAHFVKSPLGFGDTSDLNSSGADAAHGYYPWTAYGQSKLAQVEFTYELARRLRERFGNAPPVVTHVVDPGIVKTDLDRYLDMKIPQLPGVAPPSQGAKTVVFLASSSDPAVVGESGRYWQNSEPPKPSLSLGRGDNPAPWSPETAVAGTDSYNEASWKRLWDASEQLVGAKVQI